VVPESWVVSGDNTATLAATALTGEFFQVMVVDKPNDQSLVEWFMAMSPGAILMMFSVLRRFKVMMPCARPTALQHISIRERPSLHFVIQL